MAETEDYRFRDPVENEGWIERFFPCQRHSTRTGRVALVAPHVAEAILDELDERRWGTLFSKSPDVLSNLAAHAEREDQAGLTEDLDPDRL